jgi:hypothetical protein
LGFYKKIEACEYTNMGWHGSITHFEAKKLALSQDVYFSPTPIAHVSSKVVTTSLCFYLYRKASVERS